MKKYKCTVIRHLYEQWLRSDVKTEDLNVIRNTHFIYGVGVLTLVSYVITNIFCYSKRHHRQQKLWGHQIQNEYGIQVTPNRPQGERVRESLGPTTPKVVSYEGDTTHRPLLLSRLSRKPPSPPRQLSRSFTKKSLYFIGKPVLTNLPG